MVEPAKKAPKENKRQQAKEYQTRENEKGEKEFLHEASGEWVSKTEIKKREKAEEKKAKDDAKKAAQAAKKAEQEEKKPKKNPIQEEELDPTKYTENRKALLQNFRDKGENPYPHKFNRTRRIDEYVAHYNE